MTCVIAFDSEISIVHEFDMGSQDAGFEIIVGHVVAIPHAGQCKMDNSLRDSISDQNTVNDCIVSYTYTYDLFGDQDNWRLV